MASDFQISAETRDEFGTNASRRLRKSGKTPAILYGADKDNEHVLVDHNSLIHSLATEAFHSAIIDVTTPTGKQPVILRQVAMHPHKPLVLHCDFQRVKMSEKLHMSVPVHIMGEDVAPGIKMEGGLLSRLINEVDIQCLPKDLPEYLELDVSNLALNETLHLSDIKLPDGVEITALSQATDESDHDHDLGAVTITQARVASDDAAEDAAAEEGETAADEGGESTSGDDS